MKAAEKKGKGKREGGGQAEEASRTLKKLKLIERPKAARFIATPRCWAFGVRV
jgi:hypothetical protein